MNFRGNKKDASANADASLPALQSSLGVVPTEAQKELALKVKAQYGDIIQKYALFF